MIILIQNCISGVSGMESCTKGGTDWVPEADWGAVYCQCWKGVGEVAKCKETKESKQWCDELTGNNGQRIGHT